MSELDDLERDLLHAADTWFNQALHQKLQRLIAIARLAERYAPKFEQHGPAFVLRKNGDVDYIPGPAGDT